MFVIFDEFTESNAGLPIPLLESVEEIPLMKAALKALHTYYKYRSLFEMSIELSADFAQMIVDLGVTIPTISSPFGSKPVFMDDKTTTLFSDLTTITDWVESHLDSTLLWGSAKLYKVPWSNNLNFWDEAEEESKKGTEFTPDDRYLTLYDLYSFYWVWRFVKALRKYGVVALTAAGAGLTSFISRMMSDRKIQRKLNDVQEDLETANENIDTANENIDTANENITDLDDDLILAKAEIDKLVAKIGPLEETTLEALANDILSKMGTSTRVPSSAILPYLDDLFAEGTENTTTLIDLITSGLPPIVSF